MTTRRIGQRSSIAAPASSGAGAVCVAAIICAVAAFAGCNDGRKPGTARLEGRVTVDGQPPPAGAVGTVSFRATAPGQTASTSAQIVDGKYKCDDVPLGDVTVFIQLVHPTGNTVNERGRSYPELHNIISPKHDNGINLKVTDDNSNQDFELKGIANAN